MAELPQAENLIPIEPELTLRNLRANDDNLLAIGQMISLAHRIDVLALKALLVNPPADFRYARECKAAIHFKEKVWGKQ